MEKDIYYVAIDDNDLGEEVGEYALCKSCGKGHKVQYGERLLEDGSIIPSKRLGYIKCEEHDKSYLVSVDGRLVKW